MEHYIVQAGVVVEFKGAANKAVQYCTPRPARPLQREERSLSPLDSEHGSIVSHQYGLIMSTLRIEARLVS